MTTDKTEKKAKWIAGTLTGLLLLALGTTFYYYHTGLNYKSEADQARLSQDSVLAIKQLIDKELFETRANLEDAKGKNAELDAKLSAADSVLLVREQKISQLIAANATVASLRKQLAEMRTQRATMDKQIQDLLAENQQLTADNSRLAKSISQLELEKIALQDRLNAADLAASKAGNFRVEMLRNSSKVTAKSKRTNEIGVSFDLPANLSAATGGKRDIYLVLLDPKGKPVQSKTSKSVTLKDGRTIVPMQVQTIDLAENPQTVSMKADPGSKMKEKGIYQVQVFSEDGLLGAAQVRMN